MAEYDNVFGKGEASGDKNPGANPDSDSEDTDADAFLEAALPEVAADPERKIALKEYIRACVEKLG